MEKRLKAFTGSYLDDVIEESNSFLKNNEGSLQETIVDTDNMADYTIILVYTPKPKEVYEKDSR